MTNPAKIALFSVALLVSLAACCLADQQKGQAAGQVSPIAQAAPASSPKHSFLSSKLMPQPKARSARSLSDMFERVKSRIFGSKKASTAAASSQSSSVASSSAAVSPIQAAGSSASLASAVQKQPWDLNSFNQQFNPYASLSNGVYQWPSGSSISNQFMSPQSYGSLAGFGQQSNGLMSGMEGLAPVASQQQQQQQQQSAVGGQQPQSSGVGQQPGGGLFSSASHLIAQYLSPSSSSSSGAPTQGQSGSLMSSQIGQQNQQLSAMGQQSQQSQQQAIGGQQNAGLTPQQQAAQSQYQEFASILDSMVAQTGNSNVQRQPAGMNQYVQPPQQQQQQQQQPLGQGMQQSGGPSYPNQMSGAMPGSASGMSGAGDNEMASSSNIQSYMPAATQQQASAKSSMVGLAEQLAPGAQFNKLISFPFSLSTNDDQTKEGRYKLHIPFLNQHVKRSDQAASERAAAQERVKSQQQQMQQYLSSLYQQQQQQQYVSAAQYGQAQQQAQLSAQASQVVPTIVSPQSASQLAQASATGSSGVSVSQSSQPLSASSAPVSSASAVPQSQSSPVSSSSSSAASSPSSSSAAASPPASASSSSASSSVPSSSSSVSSLSASLTSQQRPSWSVSDTQSSGASSSKLIPMQAAAAADQTADLLVQS